MPDLVDIQDEPTERFTLDMLTVPQQEALLEQIRQRRLEPLRIYEELQAKKKLVKDDKLLIKIGKTSAKLQKKMDAAEKATQEAEALIREVKGLLIEMEVG